MPEHALHERVTSFERYLRNMCMAMIVIVAFFLYESLVGARGVEAYERDGAVVGRLP